MLHTCDIIHCPNIAEHYFMVDFLVTKPYSRKSKSMSLCKFHSEPFFFRKNDIKELTLEEYKTMKLLES